MKNPYQISKKVGLISNLRTFQGLYSILTKFKDIQGHEKEPIFLKDFQGFSRMWEPYHPGLYDSV